MEERYATYNVYIGRRAHRHINGLAGLSQNKYNIKSYMVLEISLRQPNARQKNLSFLELYGWFHHERQMQSTLSQ